jgi:hypothetical protein
MVDRTNFRLLSNRRTFDKSSQSRFIKIYGVNGIHGTQQGVVVSAITCAQVYPISTRRKCEYSGTNLCNLTAPD